MKTQVVVAQIFEDTIKNQQYQFYQLEILLSAAVI